MKGLIQYHFAQYLRTYLYIPPVSIFIILLIINYTYKPNPILESYSFTSLLLFFLMGWVTITILHAEDKGQQHITIMHAKNKGRYYSALVINSIIVSFILSVIAVVYPVIFDMFTPGLQPVHIFLGFLAHFSLATLSISLSLFFTRELVKNSVNTWWGVISVLIISLALSLAKEEIINIKIVDWILPPLHNSLEIMSIDDKLTSVHIQVYCQFTWIFIYSVILLTIFLMIVKKR